MSKLKAWHILVPTVILVIAAPAGIGFGKVKKTMEEVKAADEQIKQAYEAAAELHVKEAELQKAQFETAVVTKELSQVKDAKLPVWSGNGWWRDIRQGMALRPGPASIRVGEQGVPVSLPDGMATMFDVWFLLREDLALQLRDYFDSAGVDVQYDLILPTPEVKLYTAADLVMQIPINNVRVRGPYEDVLRFFRRLGYAPLLISVQGPVSFAPVDGTNGAEITATTNMVVTIVPNLPPDQMADLLPMFAGGGGGAAAAPAAGGGMTPSPMGSPGVPGAAMAAGTGAPGAPSGSGGGGGPAGSGGGGPAKR